MPSTLIVFIAVLLIAAASTSALAAPPDRISARIDSARTVVLAGHAPSIARPEFDQGPVSAALALPAVTIYLKPSAAQQTALEQLLANQQNPTSADFHKWLTPEQYADRFGLSSNDVNRISAWLQSQGMQVQRVARSRTWIQFGGTARQVQNAFHTEIHQYLGNGKLHYANATDPSIPAALSGVVLGLRGLNNYRLKPRSKPRGLEARDTTGDGEHQIAPDDFATIYDIAALYTAGINGAGQKLVVVGQTDINLSDIQAFRGKFNLPAINLQQILVPRQPDPGISQDDLPEADLDLEWSGSVARDANIIFVYSDDVLASVQEAIDQDYAPVISMSYGLCEGGDLFHLPIYRGWAQQGNAEGITWLAASGDAGAADCEDPNATIAQDGLAVDEPGSIPEVTSMGGSKFAEGTGTFWNSTNTANGASALSYIPETVWNDTSPSYGLAAGGGGTSIFFPKPVWQTGSGVPNDSFRHVPDLSIASSPEHDGYYVYTGGSLQIYGGTSIAAPTMAGIVTLLNQYLVSTKAQTDAGLGNINPTLYRMAENAQGAFHDITTGNNSVPCVIGSPNCTTGSIGYKAGPAYDQASGLGSPDAYNLIHLWKSQASTTSAVVPSIDHNPVFEQPANSSGFRWSFQITLTEEAGVATTLTAFSINGATYDVNTVFGSAQIPADGSVSSSGLELANLAVPTNVVFTFNGVDASGKQWTQTLTVPFDGPQTQLVIGGASNAASGQPAYAPGMLLSVYGTALGNFIQSAGTIPLPQYLAGFEASVNGVIAPLYYVSPNQVNIQIPYETAPGTTTLTVGNPYINVNYSLKIVPAAPGIFMTKGFTAAPFSSAARGQTSTLFITGEGQVSPALSDGTTPAAGTATSQLPQPNLPVTVTVAGLPAAIAFDGIPSGLVGVTQINYVVPATAPLGVQPVVVTVGDVASQPANLTVTQ
ncbi:MAG TPA: protease pro-enzyme activation domain-containing protein [Bryobacteraceae bacterium]|nr:protease pro-enzyme activation domain-containing protein [Bryobacteraceae bacterium]